MHTFTGVAVLRSNRPIFPPTVARSAIAAVLLLFPLQLTALDGRKVRSRAQPTYPELAKRMHVEGVVRVEATVMPDGKVEKAKAVAGHPLLEAAAEEAVLHMRFVPTSDESSVNVDVQFKLDTK